MLPSNKPVIPERGYDGPGVMPTNIFMTGAIKIILLAPPGLNDLTNTWIIAVFLLYFIR